MRPQSVSPSDKTITLVRPLLDEPKIALAEFARRRRIAFREDATNRSTDIPRNRVRRELLPLLRQKYQPNVDVIARRTMELLRAEAEFVRDEAQRWLKTPEGQPFDRIPVALQRRVVQLQLRNAGIDADFQLIEQLRLNIEEWTTLDPQTLCRLRASGRVESKTVETSSFQAVERKLLLRSTTKCMTFGSLRLAWTFKRGSRPAPKPRTEFFDADAVGEVIILRHWSAGDRFQPIGMSQPVKIQDLFVNQKIPRTSRYGLVIATTEDGQIFWVEGLRIGERFKITPATRRILQWSWRAI